MKEEQIKALVQAVKELQAPIRILNEDAAICYYCEAKFDSHAMYNGIPEAQNPQGHKSTCPWRKLKEMVE
jgi:hypothetical protein